MKRCFSIMLALLTTAALAQTPAPTTTTSQRQRPAMAETPNTDVHYKLAPDAMPQEGVPKGEIKGRPFTLPSEAYPGTQHTYWVYVPAQYDPASAASLMIYNDGQAFMAPEGDIRAQVVMDLIYRREIPVMIGVFISKNPEHHGIGRSSSGAIAAFKVAWERPDHFRKVLSNVGSLRTFAAGMRIRTSFARARRSQFVFF